MASPQLFRFGVGPGGLAPVAATAWRELARKAEALGYSTLSVSDHVMHYGPFAAMAHAAGATTTLRVGTLVLCNDFYHPAVIAREAATLDALSGGRLELGLGAGWMKADYDAMSLPFDPPSVRIARLSEAVQIIRQLLSGKACTFSGEFYDVPGLRLQFRRESAALVPVLLAGAGAKMLALAARTADIVGVNVNLAGGAWSNDVWGTATDEDTAAKARLIGEGSAHRHDRPERQIVSHFTRITDDRDATLEELSKAWGLPVRAVAASPHALVGTVEQIVDQLHECRSRFGFSYVTVDATAIDHFAPVVSRLVGT